MVGYHFGTDNRDGPKSLYRKSLTIILTSSVVMLFPLVWGLNGIWLSIVAAEVMAVMVTAAFLAGKRKKFHY